jgi:hypothetical protein
MAMNQGAKPTAMRGPALWAKRAWLWLRFGCIRSEVKVFDFGLVCEEAFYDCNGTLIGYFAYGYYQPDLPYKGI